MTERAVAETVWVDNDGVKFCELATICVMYRANCDLVNQLNWYIQNADAVGLASWGADTNTMPVKQKHDHHGRRILRILNRGKAMGNHPG